MGKVVTIKCPSCGGKVERTNNEFFARCPYCDNEVAFDEIREEAQLGEYREKLDAFERDNDRDQANRRNLKNWLMKRNIILGVMGACNCVGFSLVGFNKESVSGVGAFLVFIALSLFVAAPPLLGSWYPAYNILYNRKERGGKVIMWLKMIGLSVAVLLVSVFLAYIICEVILK